MNLGQISQVLVWGAATSYTVSLLGFTLDLARRSGGSAAGQEAKDETKRTAVTRRRALGIARSTLVMGFLLHTASLVARGVAAQRLPLANLYEFTIAGAFVAVFVYLVAARKWQLEFLGAPLAGITVLALGVAQVNFYVSPSGLQPALQSYWLAIHVTVAIAATGVLILGFLLAALQLARDYRESGARFFVGPVWRFLDGLPSVKTLERRSFEFNAIGFVLWTFTLIAGAIWAQHTWSRYWGWDPKETWTFVIWVVYAAYLHARTTRGWQGRKSAYLVLVAFACLIFNFTGVNMFFDSKHSYSQLPQS